MTTSIPLYAHSMGMILIPAVSKIQLELLGTNFTDRRSNDITLQSLIEFFESSAYQEHLSEVLVVLKLILVVPATNATSERSFSSLRRIKTFLRSTMTQSRLNHLMILHAHKEKTDSLILTDIANDFVAGHESLLSQFGKF